MNTTSIRYHGNPRKGKPTCWWLTLCCLFLTTLISIQTRAQLGSRVVVGYFHNWNAASAPYIRLADVNSKYNVVNIAFAVPVSFSDMTMTFEPVQQSITEFKADIRALQAQGRRVQISIGGATAPVELHTAADRDKFVSSMKAIITEYGFDGMDIDLEGTSVILNSGDTDFKNPATPKIVNLISASREITNHFRNQGKDFWLTAAPETQYVQGGYGFYGTAFGGYLPVLYGIRDLLTFVHVQYYNTGSQVATDEQVYSQSTADFIVAMTDMLLTGFPVGRNTANVFPALRQDQVAFGLPATNTGAAPAGGYTAPAEVTKALDYLIKGTSFGGRYVTGGTYPNLRGIMTWSVNWDNTQGDAFANSYYNYFSGLGGGGNTAPAVSITSPANNTSFTAGASVSITANAADSDGSVTKVEFYNGATKLGEDTSSPYAYAWTNVAAGAYTLTAKATDDDGATTTSAAVAITVTSSTNTPPAVSITSPASGASFTEPAFVTINAGASDTDGTVTKVEFYNGSTKLGEDTSSPYAYTWSNVGAGSYTLTAVATDNNNASTTSAAVSITVTGGSDDCAGIPQYVENGGYAAGSVVQNAGGRYECRPWPYSGWCNGAAWAYGPGTGMYWQDAWTYVGSCAAVQRLTASAVPEENTGNITMHPNPGISNKKQTISFTAEAEIGNVTVQVRSADGNGLFSGRFTAAGEMLEVEIPALPAGLYLIRMQGEAGTWTRRYLIK